MPSITLACTLLHAFILCTAFQKPSTSLSYKSRANEYLYIMKDMPDCYPLISNYQPFDYWKAHHIYYVVSQPRCCDPLFSHWRVFCLLAYNNWRCSIQPEDFHSSKCRTRAEIGTQVDDGESSMLTDRLHILLVYKNQRMLAKITGKENSCRAFCILS